MPSLIETALFDVLPHCVRNKVTQGHTAGGSGAQLPRADIESRRVERTCTVHRVGLGGAGPRGDEDRRQLADPIWRSPAREISERIAPEDQEELALRAQRLERIHRVRDTVTIELDARERKPRLAGDRGLQHRDAVRHARKWIAFLERRSSSRNEQHAVQRDRFERRERDCEVPDVHRIEGAAENADARLQRFFVAPGAASCCGASSHSSSSLPIRTVSPLFTPSVRSFPSTPDLRRRRWKYADASGLSQSIPAASRSKRSPRTRYASPSRDTFTSFAPPANTIRRSVGATASGFGRAVHSVKMRLLRRSTPSPDAAETAIASRPSASSASTIPGTAWRASARSILLSANSSGSSL